MTTYFFKKKAAAEFIISKKEGSFYGIDANLIRGHTFMKDVKKGNGWSDHQNINIHNVFFSKFSKWIELKFIHVPLA